MTTIDSLEKLVEDLNHWDAARREAGTSELTEILNSIAEIVESGIEDFYKLDPDPFDDRHPSITAPSCSLGHILQLVVDQEDLLTTLVEDYLLFSNEETLNVAGCRLLLDIVPALEIHLILRDANPLMTKLFEWAEAGNEPLSSYAIGILAVAMEVQKIATDSNDSNAVLVPILLDRLFRLKYMAAEERLPDTRRHFSMFATPQQDSVKNTEQVDLPVLINSGSPEGDAPKVPKRTLSPVAQTESFKRTKTDSLICADMSTSSWKELEPFVIGSFRMFPIDYNIQQRIILAYLTPMAEYKDFVTVAMELDAIGLILHYIDIQKNDDIRLTFAALRYLANLLCSKKFATEFIAAKGVQKLVQVPRPSVAANGVSLCFYYLSYFEYNMEKMCAFPEHEVRNIMNYALWLLECSHNSSRCHAAIFFSMCLSYRIFLDVFDEEDGLRRLVNEISTLEILNSEAEQSLLDNSFYAKRQCIRNVCSALKKYFEAHLAQKSGEILRSQARGDGRSGGAEFPHYKPYNLQPEVTHDNIEALLDYLPVMFHWKPVKAFMELNGMKLLLQLMMFAASRSGYGAKLEIIQFSLDVLAVCTTIPKAQLELLEFISLPNAHVTQGIGAIVNLAETEAFPEKDIQKSSLRVLINCVCGPMETVGGGMGRYNGVGSRKMVNMKGEKDVLQKMWESVRSNNGIMVLLKLLSTKVPITQADHIRTLACKALVGLSRSETVRQIMGKLPLFTDDQLRLLMKEPVLDEREHVNFCKFAHQLLERVTGKFQTTLRDLSLNDIRRADIVSQTKICYPQKELLQLIHEHLVSNGYKHAANALQKEADLPERNFPQFKHPSALHIYDNCPTRSPKLTRQLSHTSPSPVASSTTATSRSGQQHQVSPQVPPHPIRINLAQSRSPFSPMPPVRKINFMPSTPFRYNRDRGTSQHVGERSVSSGFGWESNMNLDRIVTEFLRKQHALCPKPVSTCPPMSLFLPHRCPSPLKRRNAPKNFTSRYLRKKWHPRHGGMHGASHDRKLIYSRFRFMRTYRGVDDGELSCCRFSVDGGHIILGNSAGVVRFLPPETGKEDLVTTCHSGVINSVEQSRDSRLLLTTASSGEPKASLWSVGKEIENLFNFGDEKYITFSNLTQDRIVGTKDETSHIYDVGTGECLLTLHSEKGNRYIKNKATFSPNDDMVLNDGILWDVRSGSVIHRFDKFNPNLSGVFHPHGLEVIINSEVWDLRNHHLLRTVPALDQFDIKFNLTGDVLYGAMCCDEWLFRDYDSTFRTFDAIDYSNIATIDLKRNIQDICMDSAESLLAVIEHPVRGENLTTEPNVCRFYLIGKQKDEEEEDDEAEDDEDDNNVEEDEEEYDEDSTIEIISVGDSADEDEEDEGDGDGEFQEGDRSGNEDGESASGSELDDVDLDDDMRFELVD